MSRWNGQRNTCFHRVLFIGLQNDGLIGVNVQSRVSRQGKFGENRIRMEFFDEELHAGITVLEIEKGLDALRRKLKK
jgi:hypothetical protein